MPCQNVVAVDGPGMMLAMTVLFYGNEAHAMEHRKAAAEAARTAAAAAAATVGSTPRTTANEKRPRTEAWADAETEVDVVGGGGPLAFPARLFPA